MQSAIVDRIRASMRIVGGVLFVLLTFSALSVSVTGRNLELCFENSGNVRIESIAGTWNVIPAETVYHPASQPGTRNAVDTASQKHHDIPLSFIYTNEEWDTTYDWEHTLNYIDNALARSVIAFPRSSVFQINTFIPAIIEDPVISSLKTVVLLN